MNANDVKEYWQGFPEAPFSDTFKWIDANGYEHMMTVRGWQGSTLLESVSKAIEVIAASGGKAPSKNTAPQAPAPQPDPAAKIALEEGNKELAAELQAQVAEVPPAVDGKTYLVFPAVFVKILPQPDNKVTIEFYGNERKQPHDQWPGVKVIKWPVERAADLMKHVTSADVSKANEFSLSCNVYYTEGKEYEPGKHYKDVHHVR